MIIWLWIGFIALILFLLALDLGVFNREAHEVSTRESFAWTAVWVAVSLLFRRRIVPAGPSARRATPAPRLRAVLGGALAEDLAEVEARMGLTATDPYRFGSGKLVDALAAV